MITTTDIINALTGSLGIISRKMVGVIIIAGVLALIYIIIEKKILCVVDRKQTRIEEFEEKRLQESELEEPLIYEPRHKKWLPADGGYDRDTRKWEPPEYPPEESGDKWNSDEEKRNWNNQDKEKLQERHRKWKQRQGGEPSYEEWKAQREKVLQQDRIS